MAARSVLAAAVVLSSLTAQFVAGPTARWGHSMVFDSARGVTVLFGGKSAVTGGTFSDTWEWDGMSWTQQTPTAAPPAQAHGAMVFDSVRNVCVFVGSGATWEYDGQSWVRNSTSGPSTRFHHSMAFDSVRGVTVLFGGSLNPSLGDALGDTWEYDGTTWTRVNVGGPIPRSHHAMAFHASTGETVLFGGQPANNRGTIFRSDTWTWNGAAWAQKSSAQTPHARTTHGLTYHAGLDRTILHGGWSSVAPGDADTWMWDGSNWAPVTPQVAPLRRAWTGQQITYDAARNECVLFGGCTAFPDVPDTWTFDGAAWRPKLEFRVSPVNGHRYAMTPPLSWTDAEGFAQLEGWHLAAVRSQAEQDWLWSTYGPSGQGANQLWIGLNDRAQPGTFVWPSNEPVTFTAWAPNQPSNGSAEDSVAMAGPAGGAWDDRAGTSIFNAIIEIPAGIDITATEIATNNPPIAVARHDIAPRPNGGALLFGGETASGLSFSTHELDIPNWNVQFPLINPLLRRGHTLILDTARGNNLLFGGENPLGTKLADTWTYANGQWTPLNPANRPAARSDHAIAYNVNTGTALLFGGVDSGGNLLADTWSWNGTNWTRLTPSIAPPARSGHKMAWDRNRGRTVLFGGTDGTNFLDDIWEWTGANWLRVTPGQPNGFAWGPAPRSHFAMAYDPVGDRVLVHGGETAWGCVRDFWSWDGVDWTLHLTTGQAPSARSGHVMYLDPVSRQLILFGGGCDGAYFNDVWRVQMPVLSSSRAFGVGCGGTAGVLGLQAQSRSLPILGQTFVAELTNVPSSPGVPFVFAGSRRDRWLSGPLPLDLSIFGMPGCFLRVSPDSVAPMSVTAGQPTFALPIPNTPAILSLRMFLQGAVADPGANAAGITVSNGLTLRLGEQ